VNTTLRRVALVICLGRIGVAGSAASFYVVPPPEGNDANPGSEAQPFATIQKGIDAASQGDTVIVSPGTYVEGVRFKGKNLVLRSTNPLDPDVVSQTVIHGNGAQIVVQFDGSESAACRLEGFTLTRGSVIGSDALGGGINGGAASQRTRATIRNNRIIDNQETGIACCDGLVEGNVISQNTSWKGAGGLAYCDGVIRGNRILENQTFQAGVAGGLAWCSGLIEGNTIAGNASASPAASGGGLAYCHGVLRSNSVSGNRSSSDAGGGFDHCDGTIEGNRITQNTAMYGGGLAHSLGLIQGNLIATNNPSGIYRCDAAVRNNVILGNQGHGLVECNGTIVNNTVCDNASYGLEDCHGPILNCIVWGNIDDGAEQLRASSVPAYSCVQHWPGGGVGNFAFAPHLLDAAAGDCRLQPWSPAIDAGDPASDASREPASSRSRIDMGAFGNTAEAGTPSPDTDSDELPDAWEEQWFGNLGQAASGDPDGDGILNLAEYRYGWDPRATAATRIQNRTQERWYETIQTALGESVKDDQIVVEPGVHRENVHFQGRNVGLRSTNPADPEVVARTIIEGYASGAVIAFDGTEDEEYCLVEGLTLRHGYAADGSREARGICGGTADRHTKAHIINNVITGSNAERGAGLIYCDGILYGNTITNNAAWTGGGLAACNGMIEANLIARNRAGLGGGLDDCDGFISRNVIAENLGHGGGGGLAGCDGMIQDNVIRGNRTEQDESSGGGLKGCDAWIAYNVIVGNRSRCDGGGGLAGCGANIVGNLIAANATDGAGGGLVYCDGLLQNNTVADNQARTSSSGGMAYCGGIIQNCIVWGNAPASGPQLLECSLPTYSCIQGWTGGGEGNLTHDPCFTSPSTGNYRLGSASPCIDAGDPGWAINLPERDLAGNCRVLYGGRRFVVDMGAYEFALVRCEMAPDRQRVTLTWNSRPGKYYYISCSANLQTWFGAVRVPSAGDSTTSWTDDGSLNSGPIAKTPACFYRIQESIR
jgi:hypothetical protein